MDSINSIQATVQQELDIFQKKLKASVQTDVPLLDQIMRYILKRKGKRVRPLLVFLSAKSLGEVNESTYHAASLVEILHTATLVHDDVVDEAEKRRGFFSINALWKSKVAVLVGDYLLSKGLLLALDNKEYQSLHLLSEAVRDMSEGELIQIKKSRTLDIKESEYFDVIERKTASLIGVATAAGAASVHAGTEMVDKMKAFGRMLGTAFQIKDDLFDYGQDNVGKPLGIDVKQKKMTLPLIYTMTQVSSDIQKKLIKVVKTENPAAAQIRELSRIVTENGGIEYATQRMMEFKQNALDILDVLPASESKSSLIALTHYVVDRKK